MRFFTGIHQPSDAGRVDAAFISVHRLVRRKGAFAANDWIMDSGAFSTIRKYGGYPNSPEIYAAEVNRWSKNGRLLAAVTQDYMCEPYMLRLTGRSVHEHQALTIERFDAIGACDLGGVYQMPVLQGYSPDEYVQHLKTYGDRLDECARSPALSRAFPPVVGEKPAVGAWVGVGSVCKRNGNPAAIEEVLLAIKRERPELRLHGFGIKATALGSALVRALLASADSMAWSFAARREGRDANSVQEAIRYTNRIARNAPEPTLLSSMLLPVWSSPTTDSADRPL
ncbi:MAG TPA: hypothetical protein VN231_05995 [Allosphingosinicella sp.]|nr:hypothetical protein [Allosphingosinicella sp.]